MEKNKSQSQMDLSKKSAPGPFQLLKTKISSMLAFFIPRKRREWDRRDTKILVLMGLFVALSIVLTRIIKPIDLPVVRVSFGFIATSFASMLLGPFISGTIAAVSDIAGFFLFPSPSGGAFFPGFTLSAFLAGVLYAVFLYNKPKTLLRIILAVLSVSIIVDLGLNTLWLQILLNKAWTTFFVARAIKTAIWFPVQIVLIKLMWKYIGAKTQAQFGLPANKQFNASSK